jgi:hypothetical protein
VKDPAFFVIDADYLLRERRSSLAPYTVTPAASSASVAGSGTDEAPPPGTPGAWQSQGTNEQYHSAAEAVWIPTNITSGAATAIFIQLFTKLSPVIPIRKCQDPARAFANREPDSYVFDAPAIRIFGGPASVKLFDENRFSRAPALVT